MLVVVICIIALYSLAVFVLSIAWVKIPAYQSKGNIVEAGISVIIAFRNEKDHLEKLINALSNQNHKIFEVVLVDDHSEDGSFEYADQLVKEKPHFSVIQLGAGVEGKKAALNLGIGKARFEQLIFTDADCFMGNNWLGSMVNFKVETSAGFVFGPVRYIADSSIFSRLLNMEQLSLIVTAASTWNMGIGTMCNGANLIYNSDYHRAYAKYLDSIPSPSGDDEFLYHALLKDVPGKVKFIKCQESIVYTFPPGNWKEFISQRKRWASKWPHYKNKPAVLLAQFIFLVNFLSLTVILSCLFGYLSFYFVIVTYFLRAIPEFLLLCSVSRFLKERFDFLSFFIVLVLYPVYAVSIPIISLLSRYEWKERSFK